MSPVMFSSPSNDSSVNALLFSTICAGLVLLLFMPLVVTPWTLSPTVFGKAIYARVLILIIVALWITLSLRDSTYRVPRSWVLLAFAVYIFVVFLSAIFGVSPQDSLRSNYSRMTGFGTWCYGSS